MKKYSVGIIGLGRIASLYEKDSKARKYYSSLTHAGTFTHHPATRIVCAADPNPAQRKQFAKDWGVPAIYADHRRMLQEHQPDILSICTPPEHHLSIIRDAVGKVPVIFCEKPMGRSLQEASQIHRLCQNSGTRLSVNFYRLFDPSHQEVGRRIRQGLIGPIQRINCFYGRGLRNMGTHLISWLLAYGGRIVSVKTLTLKTLGDIAEPTADFVATLDNGAPCYFQGCDFRNYRIFEIDVLGKKGRILLDREGFGFHFSRSAANRAQSGAKELVTYRSPVQSTVGRAFYHAADHLVKTLKNGGKMLSSSQDYLNTERVVDAVLKSARLSSPVRVVMA